VDYGFILDTISKFYYYINIATILNPTDILCLYQNPYLNLTVNWNYNCNLYFLCNLLPWRWSKFWSK